MMTRFRSADLAPSAVALAVVGGATLCAAGEPLTFDILFAEEGNGRSATQLTWSEAGDQLAFTWADTEGDDSALWILNPTTVRGFRLGTPVDLLGEAPADEADANGDGDAEEDAATEDGFDSIAWYPDGEALLLAARGGLHRLALADRRVSTLVEDASALSDVQLAPSGDKIAFHRDLELWVRDLETGDEHAVTSGAVEDRTLNAETDWVYWEEIWNRKTRGYWWSPDGRRIAYYQFDEEPVDSYPLVDFLPVYPEVEWQKYPKAGTANPRVRIGVVDIATRETNWIDTASDEESYLARVDWAPADGSLMVQRLNREQTRLDLLRCDPTEGACAVVLTETHPTWVNLDDDYRYLENGNILWGSERSGWRRLYLYDRSGELLGPATPESWNVTSLDAVLEDDSILFSGYRTADLGGWHRSVLRGDPEAGTARAIAGEPGWNTADAGSKGYWVHHWSDANSPTTITLLDGAGLKIADLPQQSATNYSAVDLPPAELLTIPGPEGSTLPALMIKPLEFDASRRYPVLMYHYGGPDSQVVRDAWGSRGRGLWHKMMAERGYVVFSVDNQASIFFGKTGEDLVHRRFGEVNLAAQLAAVEYLKGLEFVDADRIGLWGWSGGGSNTLYCLTNAPGVWRAGMSGAPVTDWRLYDTIWTERYLDHPDDNAEGYVDSSAVTHAENLKDALLIVHGTADDNVHPANTIAYSQKLIEAGIPFEQAIYPRQKHGLQDEASRHFYEKMTRFFDRELAPREAPDVSPAVEPVGR